MSVLVILLIAGILLAAGFLAGFIWAVRNGQFDDTTTPALRILSDGPVTKHPSEGGSVQPIEREKNRASR